jgi:hypothetical protein
VCLETGEQFFSPDTYRAPATNGLGATEAHARV